MFFPLPSSPNLASATPKKCVPSRFFSSVSHVHPLTEAPQDCREHCSDFISSLCARKWKNNRRMKKKKKKGSRVGTSPFFLHVNTSPTETRSFFRRGLFQLQDIGTLGRAHLFVAEASAAAEQLRRPSNCTSTVDASSRRRLT